MSAAPPEISALRSLGQAQRTDEYIEFWPAGALATGVFSCVACGRTVLSTYQLHPCPTCDGRLWEDPSSSPFAQAEMPLTTRLAAYEEWEADDLSRTADFVRGASLAVVVGPVLWLCLAASALMLLR